MGDTLITVICIGLTATLLFVFPVMSMAERVDKVSQLDVETLTSKFLNEIKITGKLTKEKYAEFMTNLTADGNLYDVEFEFKIMDENPGKKTIQSVKDRIGENVYYSVFTTQIENELESYNVYKLKEGDIATVTVRNVNSTFSQRIKDIIYTSVGSDIYTIRTKQSALVITSGSN